MVDQWYPCDLCCVVQCPYVPPHPWQLDFPHLMLCAQVIKFKACLVSPFVQLLASTGAHGSFAGIPVVVQLVNAMYRTRLARSVMDRALGVHPDAWMPDFATQRLRWGAAKVGIATQLVDGARAPGTVAIFATCYVSYTEPGIGIALLKLLVHNQIACVIVETESCCGMPKLELGDLAGVGQHKDANIPVLVRCAREGNAILSAVPSCTLMFEQELPLLIPDEADVQPVKGAMFDPFEYLMAHQKDGLLKTDFKRDQGRISYPIPCHGWVPKIGRKTEEMFKLTGQSVTVTLNTVERCSGHAGTPAKSLDHPADAAALRLRIGLL